MLNIRPISDLRNNYQEVSKEVKESKEPLVLTKNGYADMVLMSVEQYAEIQETKELHQKILESELQYQKDGKTYTSDEVFNEMYALIEEKFNVQNKLQHKG